MDVSRYRSIFNGVKQYDIRFDASGDLLVLKGLQALNINYKTGEILRGINSEGYLLYNFNNSYQHFGIGDSHVITLHPSDFSHQYINQRPYIVCDKDKFQ